MRKRFLQGLCLCGFLLFAVTLAACGGGGASATGGTRQTAAPQPTGSPRSYQVHIVIGLSGQRQTQTVPGNGNNGAAVPRGGSDAGPLPGAKIAYPDGSVQTADSLGVFAPAQSPFGVANQKLLQTNPNAQPLVIVSDPSGKAKPSTARVAAYASATLPKAVVRSPKSTTLLSVENLAGIALLQPTSSIFSTDTLDLDVQGSDLHDNVVDLSSAVITYSSSAGGTFQQFAGTTEAYYTPPDVATGSITDSITATVTVPNTNVQFSASNNVVVVAGTSAVQVAGNMKTSTGAVMPGAVALFAQLSRYFPPNYWLAAADDSGAYGVAVPSSQLFSLVVGAPAAFSPSGSFDYFIGASTSDGTVSTYNSGAAGSSAALDLFLPASATIFTNAPSDSLPPYVAFVRDAWYNTVDASTARIFDAQSGIQPLLASVPSSFPSPATPVPVGAGQLKNWCYQWEQPAGSAPTLVVAEATGANCTQAGNDGFTITAGPAANSFSYVKYMSNTTYSLGGPLDVSTNAMLVESGTWSQSLTGSPSAISADLATVTVQLYDAANQTLGSPVYNDALSYAYSVDSRGLSTEQYANDTRTSGIDGSIISVYNSTKVQTAQLSACQGTASQCYTVSGNVVESYDPSSGTFTKSFTIGSILNGDGSAQLTYQSANSGDLSKIVIPLVSDAQQNASPYCLVCASNAASLYDVDGTTKIGSFTVSSARLVQFLAIDPATMQVVDGLGFII